MWPKIAIVYLLIAGIGGAVYGQSRPVKFTALGMRDGLSANSVNAILKDHYGWMWFATNDGLNRFDGTNFTVYRHKAGDSSSLRANEIVALYEDKAGNLWVGTSGGAFSLYDRKRDAFINFPASGGSGALLPSALVRSITSDKDGRIWVAQYEAPYVLDPATGGIEKLDLQGSAAIPTEKVTLYCVFGDSRSRMWVGTDHGLFLYQGDRRGFRQYRHVSADAGSLAEDNVRAIAEDSLFSKKLDNFISDNLSNPNLSVDLLARLMNMSRPTFYRKLKDRGDASPLELINTARLKKAAGLIKSTNHTIAEVAIMVGFHSRSNFGKAFYKQFHLSPTDFRAKHTLSYDK